MHPLRLSPPQRKAREANLDDDRFAPERAVRDQSHRLARNKAKFAEPAPDRVAGVAQHHRAHTGALTAG
jgi:hypothetical protein